MKKSTRNTLILAGILMLLGGITALVCLVLGADIDDLRFYVDHTAEQEEYPLSGDRVIELLEQAEDVDTWEFVGAEIHSLDLDVEAGTLYLEHGDDWKVTVADGRKGLQCYVKNGVLVIDETDSIHTLLAPMKNTPVIHVTFPADVLRGMGFDNVQLTVGAGQLQVDSMKAITLEVDVDAGSVMINNSRIAKRMEIDIDAGNVIYNGSLEGDWSVDCDAGDVEIELAGDMTDHNYRIQYDMGRVQIGEQILDGMSDASYLDHGASYEANILCNVGNVTVKFAE